MTQDELGKIHARIQSMMDYTMVLHAENIAIRGIQTSLAYRWKSFAFALGVMVLGAGWGIGCLLLFRAL